MGAERYPDQEFDAGIEILKDSTIDLRNFGAGGGPGATTSDDSVGLGIGGAVGQTTTGADPSDGWHAKRMVEVAETSPNGARHYARDKEYDFRPKFAKLVNDMVNYRDFREPPEGSSEAETSPLNPDLLVLGVPEGGAGGGTVPASWNVAPEEVGFELSMISDSVNFLKTKPDFNPSHMNGRNQSALIISKEDPTSADTDRDLPRRYFGRAHDTVIVRQTQDVKLKRVEFNAPRSGHFKKTRTTKDYQDGFWKAMWNITPFEQPFEKLIDQLNEHEEGPDKHGFRAHDYATAIDPEGILIKPPVFQGGWMVDQVLDVAGQIHDILGIGRGGNYTRYKARDGKEVAIVYIRHDAMFAKTPSEIGRIHFIGKNNAAIAFGDPFWADIYLDEDQKGLDTNLDEPPPDTIHETGQWRPRYSIPPPITFPPWCSPPPSDLWLIAGESVPVQPASYGGYELPLPPLPSTPFVGGDKPTQPGWFHRYQPDEFEGLTSHTDLIQVPVHPSASEVGLTISLQVMAEELVPIGQVIELVLLFRIQPLCPLLPAPPLVELFQTFGRAPLNVELSDKGFKTVTFEIGAGYFDGITEGTLEFGVMKTSSTNSIRPSSSTKALMVGMASIKTQPAGKTSAVAAPGEPTTLVQRDGASVIIVAGGTTSGGTVEFEATVDDPATLRTFLDVELVLTSETFEQKSTENGITGVIPPGTASVTITGIAAGTYKWQVRARNEKGMASKWVQFDDPSFTMT